MLNVLIIYVCIFMLVIVLWVFNYLDRRKGKMKEMKKGERLGSSYV